MFYTPTLKNGVLLRNIVNDIFCITASVPFFSVPAALLLYLAPEGSD